MRINLYERDGQNALFGYTIHKLNTATTVREAKAVSTRTCDMLCGVGYCNSRSCEQCKMTASFERAVEEIRRGLRQRQAQRVSSC